MPFRTQELKDKAIIVLQEANNLGLVRQGCTHDGKGNPWCTIGWLSHATGGSVANTGDARTSVEQAYGLSFHDTQCIVMLNDDQGPKKALEWIKRMSIRE